MLQQAIANAIFISNHVDGNILTEVAKEVNIQQNSILLFGLFVRPVRNSFCFFFF